MTRGVMDETRRSGLYENAMSEGDDDDARVCRDGS